MFNCSLHCSLCVRGCGLPEVSIMSKTIFISMYEYIYYRADSFGRNVYMYVRMCASTDLNVELLHGSRDTYVSMYLPHCMAAEMHMSYMAYPRCTLVTNEAYSISRKKKAYHYLPATVLQRKDARKLNWKDGGGGSTQRQSPYGIKSNFSKVSALVLLQQVSTDRTFKNEYLQRWKRQQQ